MNIILLVSSFKIFGGDILKGFSQFKLFVSTKRPLCFQNKSAISDSSPPAHSSGDESNSSDTEMSERGGGMGSYQHHGALSDLMIKSESREYAGSEHMGPLDGASRANFPAALLGLQGKLRFCEQS